MKMLVARFAYRLLLRLHPSSFQDEFGGEMLWVFDEEFKQGNAGYLLRDGVTSVLRQRCRIQSDPGQLSIASGVVISGPGIEPIRFLQAAIALSAILFSLLQLLSHSGLFTVSVRWKDQTPCYTVTLQAPSHAEVVLGTMP
jgi:hypothetical protein